MKLQTFFAACVLLGVVVYAACAADTTSANQRPENQANKALLVADSETQAGKLARYAMPGPEHKLLDRMAGSWDTFTRYWPSPGTEPLEAKGASQRKWVLGGRFLMEEMDGGNLLLPFRGMGFYGYDAFEQKHTSAWMDTLNTSILSNSGTFDTTNDVVNFTGLYKDPWTGARKPERGVTRFLGKDKHVLEIHVTESDGKEFKMLEITYTRQPPQLK